MGAVKQGGPGGTWPRRGRAASRRVGRPKACSVPTRRHSRCPHSRVRLWWWRGRTATGCGLRARAPLGGNSTGRRTRRSLRTGVGKRKCKSGRRPAAGGRSPGEGQ